MSRSAVTSAIQLVLNALGMPGMAVCVSFASLGVSVCNAHRDITLGSTTYTALGRKGIVARGLGESLAPEVGTPQLAISSLDGTYQEHVADDELRSDIVTITIAYLSAGTWTSTGWSAAFPVDMDLGTTDEVRLTLRSAAARKVRVGRRTTQEDGCQETYKLGGCPYRGSLTTCDYSLFGPNGCAAHFQNLTVTERGVQRTLVQPKPYSGFPGHMPHSLVRRG